jgi:predicted nucleic acid-binding protein
MRILLDATTLIGLGTVGELDRLTNFDGDLVCCPAVRDEVTTEPARTNLERFCEVRDVRTDYPSDGPHLEQARQLLDEETLTGDVQIVAACLAGLDANEPMALVSDDRRLRTVADGLDVTVTGTIGVVVRAVEEGLSPSAGKDLVRQLDEHGLHMTAELRERADELIDEAAAPGEE